MRVNPMAGLVGVRFLLDFTMYLFLAPNGQGIPVLAAPLNIIIRDQEKHGQKSCALCTTSGILP